MCPSYIWKYHSKGLRAGQREIQKLDELLWKRHTWSDGCTERVYGKKRPKTAPLERTKVSGKPKERKNITFFVFFFFLIIHK